MEMGKIIEKIAQYRNKKVIHMRIWQMSWSLLLLHIEK